MSPFASSPFTRQPGQEDENGKLSDEVHLKQDIVELAQPTERLSLTSLLVSEGFQSIENDAQKLLFSVQNHAYGDKSPRSVKKNDLYGMLRLSENITYKLGNIIGICRQDAKAKRFQVQTEDEDQPKRKRTQHKRTVERQCHACATSRTPKWRTGPRGPRTLCNLCGLLYVKREHRQAARLAKLRHNAKDIMWATRKYVPLHPFNG
ncbi:GATA zinc finger domain-containing protein 8 [Cladobotryum mycophilum]|uniref:GATA zinc finger domain-containing protein 8 n=1 Tax=Cladobotryum mycophilum TaxID=491253 RepID=A0ABR0SIG0_9HYPO